MTRIFKIICSFFLTVILFTSCNLNSKSDYNNGYKAGYLDGINGAVKGETNPDNDIRVPNSSVPQKVYQTLDYIRKNNCAPEGYVGGRHFGNFEHNLPELDANGNTIEYQEWDVNPKTAGRNRGAQRLVTGDNGKAWYTDNHYKSFTEVK